MHEYQNKYLKLAYPSILFTHPLGGYYQQKFGNRISHAKILLPVLDQYIRFTNVYYQCPVPRKSSTSTRQLNASFYQAVYYQTCTKKLPLLFHHKITRKLPTHFSKFAKKYMWCPLCYSYVCTIVPLPRN